MRKTYTPITHTPRAYTLGLGISRFLSLETAVDMTKYNFKKSNTAKLILYYTIKSGSPTLLLFL